MFVELQQLTGGGKAAIKERKTRGILNTN